MPCHAKANNAPVGGAPVLLLFLFRLSSPDPCSRRETQDFRGQPYEIDFLPRGKVPLEPGLLLCCELAFLQNNATTTSSLLVKVEVGSDGLHRHPFHSANYYAPTGTGFGARRSKSLTARWMLTDPPWLAASAPQVRSEAPTPELQVNGLLERRYADLGPCSSDVWNRQSIRRCNRCERSVLPVSKTLLSLSSPSAT